MSPHRQSPTTVPLSHDMAGATGPPVLLIQGVGAIGTAWRHQIEALAENHRVLSFDNRGIGRSPASPEPLTIEGMAADTLALLDRVRWPSAHIVGHSMGGLIACQLALEAPRRVRSLSLLCTFSRGPEAARLTPWVLWMGLRTRLGSRPMRRSAFLKMLFSKKTLATADHDRLAKDTGDLVGRDLADSPPILLHQLRACARHDVRSRLPELAGIPTSVISAEFDRIAHPSYGRALAAAIPHASFHLHHGVSHGHLLEQPEWLNHRLIHHIAAAESTITLTR